MSDGEDFFLEADDQISTVSQLTKRKRRVSHGNRNVKKQKIETNESDDEESQDTMKEPKDSIIDV